MELVVLTFFSVELLLSFYKQINMNEKKNTCVRKRINKIIIKKNNIKYLLPSSDNSWNASTIHPSC